MKLLQVFLAVCNIICIQYIVMFKPPPQGKQNTAIYSNYLRLQKAHFKKEDTIIKSFGYGYIGQLSKETIKELEKEPYVKILEPDQKISVQHFKGDYFDASQLESNEESSNEEENMKLNKNEHENELGGNKKIILKRKLFDINKEDYFGKNFDLEHKNKIGNKNGKETDNFFDFDTNLKEEGAFNKKNHFNNNFLKKEIEITKIPKINYNFQESKKNQNEDLMKNIVDSEILRHKNLYKDNLSLKNKKLQQFYRVKPKFTNGIISKQDSATWGLKKISKGYESSKKSYAFPEDAGSNAVVFVLDTGIDIKHREFKGRAIWGVNLVLGSPDTDENGHGTHCAGVIAGERVGVAKKTHVVAVKVLDKHGEGLVSRLVLGIDYVIRIFSEETEKDEEKKRSRYLQNNPGFKKWSSFFSEGMKILDDLQLQSPLIFDGQNNLEDSGDENLGESISEYEEDIINIIGGDTLKGKDENTVFNDLKFGAEKNGKINRLNSPNFGANGKSRFIRNFKNYMESGTKNPKFVVNMSVGGVKSKALDFAVEYASQLGIHFVAAAGNDNDDACDFSPSSSRVVITTGASTKKDKVAFFSNYGSCVDIFAPGVDVLSSWTGNAYRLAEGTSMASPHVAGVAALYVSAYDFTPSELKKRMINDAAYVIEEQEHEHKLYSVPDFFNNRDIIEHKIGYKLPLLNTSNLMKRIVEDKKED